MCYFFPTFSSTIARVIAEIIMQRSFANFTIDMRTRNLYILGFESSLTIFTE